MLPKCWNIYELINTFDPAGGDQSGQVFIIDKLVELVVYPEGYLKTATGINFRFVFRHFFAGNEVEQWCPQNLITSLACKRGAFKDLPLWLYIPLRNNLYKPDDIAFIPRRIYFFQPTL